AQSCRTRGLTLSTRWKNAVSFAKRMMSQEDRVCSKGAWLKAYLAFVSALAVVFLVPSAASRLKTWQDCWGMGFNLMFLSALPGAVLAVGTSITNPVMNDRKKKRASDCLDGCDCECCDCCNCPSDCGCGSCDGCCDGCCGHGGCCDGCCGHGAGCDGCCDGCSCDCHCH